MVKRGSSSVGRALAFQANCRGFKSRLPPNGLGFNFAADGYADVAQQVECVLGKDEVTGSSPVVGSISFLIRLK